MKDHELSVIIVGAGQAGIAMSYHLLQAKINHIILERDTPFHSWRNQRWDSFRLVTQNWQNQLPGCNFTHNHRNAFLSKAGLLQSLEESLKKNKFPIRYPTEVTQISRTAHGSFKVQTQGEVFYSSAIVIATGSFSRPHFPFDRTQFPKRIIQLHSAEYRNPRSLPDGAILVVGGGQSGFQITKELLESRKEVLFSFGQCTWLPRTYRGRDILEWLDLVGIVDLPTDQFPNPREARFITSPVICESAGGFRTLIKDGVKVLGRLARIQEQVMHFDHGLKKSFAESDLFYFRATHLIDQYIKRHRLKATQKEPLKTALLRSVAMPQQAATQLECNKISTLVWATGFREDYSFVRLPVFDSQGQPLVKRGITNVGGCYFLGLHRLYNFKSGSLYGVGDDAEYLLPHIVSHLKAGQLTGNSLANHPM